jgi:exosortase A-associated hydrolase 1
MTGEERLLVYDCGSGKAVGVLHMPGQPPSTGIVVIGRWGSDRLSVHLGRAAAERGIALFRFDARGRGDSEGPLIGVDEFADDIGAAVKVLREQVPGVRRVVIFGLSEGAAAALLYANRDPSVRGLILVNPWIRMDQAVAQEELRQNFGRLGSRSFWMRIRKSEAGLRGAARSFSILVENWWEASRKQPDEKDRSLKDRLMDCLTLFPGKLQIILSGGDPASAIFRAAAKEQLEKLQQQDRLEIRIEPEANHVFSRSDWRGSLIDWSLSWAKDLV